MKKINVIVKKIKRWLDYDCPQFGTPDVFVEHDERFKQNAPVRYFINNKIKRIKIFFSVLDSRIYNYLLKHIAKENTIRVDFSESMEYDSILLNASFKVLEKFVERDCARTCTDFYANENLRLTGGTLIAYSTIFGRVYTSEDNTFVTRAKILFDKFLYKIIPYATILYIKNFSSSEHGIKYLLHRLEDLGDVDSPTYKKELDVLYLYIWWKFIRPKRRYMLLPYPDEYEHLFMDRSIIYLFSNKFKTDFPTLHDQLEEIRSYNYKLEEAWKKEDNEMLAKLVSVRNYLWV